MKCRTKHCRRVPAKRSKTPWCARCKTRIAKEKNPHAYFLRKLRHNAGRRGIECSISIAEFKAFCDETGYLDAKGRHAECASMDRIRGWEGYVKGNLQILTVSENSRKAHVPYFQNLARQIPVLPAGGGLVEVKNKSCGLLGRWA